MLIHLHNHSDASICDGLFSPKKWCEVLKDKGFKAHALTDHGVMTNLLAFYKAAKDTGITPILGVEAYFVDDPLDKTSTNRRSSHLVLLAKNYEGYRNLCKLSYLSFTDGFYYRNRIGIDWIRKHSEGIVCLSACQGGVLANEVWRQKKGEPSIGIVKRYEQFREIFGDDFYVEFQPHNTINTEEDGSTFNSQALINEALFKDLRGQIGFKPIVTNDCHYILQEHAVIQKKLKEMQWSRGADTSAESKTVTKDYSCDSLWLKAENDLKDSFKKHHGYLPMKLIEDGVLNTEEVLDKCAHFEFPKSRYLPVFKPKTKIPVSSKKFFLALTKKLLIDFLKDGDLHASKKEYVERFKKEFVVISKYNLEDYFLIVWDLIRFAKSKGIYSGLGRGSAAGCLISYLMGIVKIDPLEHKLIFERFLNENRCETGELPDIDLDFESDKRGEIKTYIFDKYGLDHVCEIGTYGRMKLKTAIIDFGKAFEVGTDKELHAITTKLDLDKEDAQSLMAACEADSTLMQLCEDNPEFAFTVDEINGQIKSQGVHPAGVLICSDNISELLPLKTQNSKSEGRVLTTQPEDKYVIAQGFMKMDILGLKEYDVIRYVLENAPGCKFTIDNYVEKIMAMEREEPNEEVWKMFQAGKSDAVFQFSSSGMKELLQMIVPTHINDLIAANALYRPGCLENGWHIQYCKRKHGKEDVEYAHEDVEISLKDTFGVIVFQEQFMDVIHRLGGISLVESDIIRSALGKKDKAKLGKFKAKFVEGASKKITKYDAEALWDQIEKASGYSFNKSHSAVYSVLAYISQYLKVYYPAYFWAAQIDWDIRKNKLDEMLINKRAAKEMGIEFLPPSVNRSKTKISADSSGVIWSLTSIKGLGEKAAIEIQDQQPYANFEDFYKRVNKTKVKYNNIQALILAGAMDEFGDRRDLLSGLVDLHNKRSSSKKRKVTYSDEDMIMEFYRSMGFFEKKIKSVRTFSSSVLTEQDLREIGEGDNIALGGMISKVKVITTKKGDKMCFLTLTDLDEEIEVTCFSKVYEVYKENFKEGKIVELHGVKSCYKEQQNLIELQRVIEI